MNSRSVGIFAVVVAILVGASVYFLMSDMAPHHVDKPEPTPVPKAAPSATVGSPRPAGDPGPTIAPDRTPKETLPKPGTTPPKPPVELTEDDRKIDEVLRMFPGNSDQDHTNTAQALLQMLPTLSPDGQVEAAQHVSNLLSDSEYNRVMPIWRNPQFNPDVIEVFATDLMNREHKVMLPAMLDAIRMPNHPFHEEAKTTMEVFLDGDFGNDIPKWEKAMKDFLKKEAEEEAAANAPQ